MSLSPTIINVLLGGLNVAQNSGSGNISQSLASSNPLASLGNLGGNTVLGNTVFGNTLFGRSLFGGGLSSSSVLVDLLRQRLAPPPPRPSLDINTLLLISLLGGGDALGSLKDLLCGRCNNKPHKPTSIIDLLFPPGSGVGPINTGEGDPHMNVHGVGKFDFHGPSTAKPNTSSFIRLADDPNGSAINFGLRHLDYKLGGQNVYASFFHDFSAKLGNSKVAVSADNRSMSIDGKEVKVGDGVAISLGNGKSASVSRPDDTRFVINTGHQILTATWKKIDAAGAKGYFDVATQVTDAGLDAKGPAGGLMNLGHVGLDANTLKTITGNQDTMYSLFKVDGLDDFNGQRLPEGAKFVDAFKGQGSTGNL